MLVSPGDLGLTPLILPTLLILVIMETFLTGSNLLSHQWGGGETVGIQARSWAAQQLRGQPAAHGDVQWENQCWPITNYQNNGRLRGEAEVWQFIYPETTPSYRLLLVNA